MYTLIRQAASLLRMMEIYDNRVAVIKEILGVEVDGLRDLSDNKLRELIKHLRILYYKGVAESKSNPAPAPVVDSDDKMRKTIISLAYQMQWAAAGDWRSAVDAINAFCNSPKGVFKKDLNKHTTKELNEVVTQFRQMHKSFLKQVAKK